METAARTKAEFSTAQTGIPALLGLVAFYLVGGALLDLVIAVFLWARKQWEPEATTTAEQELPETAEQWDELIDAATGHTNDGRPICLKCGAPIPEGKETLLTDDEKNALARRRGVESLPGAFRHMNEADCRAGSK